MIRHDALEEQVRRNPDERLGWLVLADWLLEQGDLRGEAIRKYVAMEASPTEPLPEGLRDEYRRLCDLGEVGDHPSLRYAEWRYGFVHSVTVLGPGAVDALEAVDDHPAGRLLTEVRMTGRPDLARLARSEVLDRIGVLDLHGLRVGDEGIALLAPRLGHLTALYLPRCGIGPTGAAALAEAYFDRMQVLDLSDNAIGSSGGLALARAPWVGALTRLDLHQTGVRGAAIGALVEAEPTSLAHLDLSSNELDREALDALVVGPMPALAYLSLRDNPIGPKGGEILSGGALATPNVLDLGQTRLKDTGFADLIRSPWAQGLRELRVDHNGISESGLTALVRSPLAGRLRTLIATCGPGVADAMMLDPAMRGTTVI